MNSDNHLTDALGYAIGGAFTSCMPAASSSTQTTDSWWLDEVNAYSMRGRDILVKPRPRPLKPKPVPVRNMTRRLRPMRRTVTIQLKIDVSDERYEALVEAAKYTARTLFAQASLIAERRKPEISLKTDDMFLGTQDLNVLEDAS